jgi:malonate decarboxylase alpha subunit
MDVFHRTDWQSERHGRDERMKAGRQFADGKMVGEAGVTALLEAVIMPGDRVCLEGDNQKQADFLAASLAACFRRNVSNHGP